MDYIGEIMALGIDAVIFGVCSKLYLKSRNSVKAIQEVPTLEINPKLQDLISSFPESKIPYAAVRGTVKALGQPIRSHNSPDITGVIQKISLKEHTVTRSTAGFWAEHERMIREVKNVVPFVLRNGGTELEVLDPFSADILDLATIADSFEPSNPGLLSHIWGFFMGVRQRGLQNTEDMLQEGSLMTGIGEIFLTTDGLKLQAPLNGMPMYLTSLPIPTLLRKLQERQRLYRCFTLIFGALGIFILGLIVHKWWQNKMRKLTEEKNRRKLEETRRERRSRVRDSKVDLSDNQVCVVCQQNPRELIILPCGHVCICEDCSEGLNDLCPVCRREIETLSPAYIV